MEFPPLGDEKKTIITKVFLQAKRGDCPAWSLEFEKITHKKIKNNSYTMIQFKNI